MDAVNIEFVSRLLVFVSNVDKKTELLNYSATAYSARDDGNYCTASIFIPSERIQKEFHEGF